MIIAYSSAILSAEASQLHKSKVRRYQSGFIRISSPTASLLAPLPSLLDLGAIVIEECSKLGCCGFQLLGLYCATHAVTMSNLFIPIKKTKLITFPPEGERRVRAEAILVLLQQIRPSTRLIEGNQRMKLAVLGGEAEF